MQSRRSSSRRKRRARSSHVLVTDGDLTIDLTDVPEDVIVREDVTPDDFGRIAAQTAKQVILQRIREAEREMMYEEYIDRVNEVVTGIVQQARTATTCSSTSARWSRCRAQSRWTASATSKGAGSRPSSPRCGRARRARRSSSRRDPELIRTLFELEVPEIADGLVEIRAVAREPGYRSKIAVESHVQGVDPVGACVGPRVCACAWSSRSSAERRSTSSRGTPSPRASSRRRSLPHACARCTSMTTRRRRRSSSRRPAGTCDRQGGLERPPRRPSVRLEGRYQVGHGVRPGGGRRGLRRADDGNSIGRCFAILDRQALPEQRTARLALLRRSRTPGAGDPRGCRRGHLRTDRATGC